MAKLNIKEVPKGAAESASFASAPERTLPSSLLLRDTPDETSPNRQELAPILFAESSPGDLWEPFGEDMWDGIRDNIQEFRQSLAADNE